MPSIADVQALHVSTWIEASTRELAAPSAASASCATLVFGNRFDDNLPLTLGVAGRLRRQGTRIYAFHVGRNPRSRYAYE